MIIHASRSRQEAFHHCRRYGFLQYHYGGRGIVKAARNIFLSTGIIVHRGLELIGKWLKEHKEQEVPEHMLGWIIEKVIDEYFKLVFPKGFDLVEEGWEEGE